MKISIVTATLNRSATIETAVESLHNQSFSGWEHIIQDGCSDDDTLERLNCWRDDRRVVVAEPDGGIYDAINRGIRRSTGDVIGLLHSDDFFSRDDVLEMVADQMQDDQVDGVYGDLVYVSSINTTKVVRHWNAGVYRRDALKLGWMPPHPTLFLRRRVFDRWGAYNSGYRISADYEAMLRWLILGQIRVNYIPEVLVKMRTGGESNKSISRIFAKSREDYRAIRTHQIGGFTTLLCKNLRKLKQFCVSV